MPGKTRANGQSRAKRVAGATQTGWSVAELRQAMATLQREVTGRHVPAVTDAIVAYATQPTLWAALCGRSDHQVAVRDVVVRRAFALVYTGREAALDALSRALLDHTLAFIQKTAEAEAQRHGLDPLDADDRLLVELGEQLAHHTLAKPLAAHIRFRLRHPEDPVREFMQKALYLVARTPMSEPFVAFVQAVPLPDEFQACLRDLASGADAQKTDDRLAAEFRARLQALARGAKESAVRVHPEAVVRFFALPATVEFVAGFADRVQTARALYAPTDYADIPWHGPRKPQCTMRTGFVDRALAQVEARRERSLDQRDADGEGQGQGDRHEHTQSQVGLDDMTDRLPLDPGVSLPAWITGVAIAKRPDDPVWRANRLLYVDGLSAERILADNLASPEALTEAQGRMQALVANPQVLEAWEAAITG